MYVYEGRRIFRAAPKSAAVVALLTGPPLYIIKLVVPIPFHPSPATLIVRRRTFIIYYSRRTVRKRQVLVCCLYNQLARYTRSYIILYTYLLLGNISIMYVERRERQRNMEREGERERRAKIDYVNVYCIYVYECAWRRNIIKMAAKGRGKTYNTVVLHCIYASLEIIHRVVGIYFSDKTNASTGGGRELVTYL